MDNIFYQDGNTIIANDSSLAYLKTLEENSIDSIVTDPPYALTELTAKSLEAITEWVNGNREFVPDGGQGFRGMSWDNFVPPPALWDECFRVLKPGGYLLSFAGSRTQDLMGVSIRFAGFEIKDGIAWIQSSGFPKSLDISKSIAKRISKGEKILDSETDKWVGWGTALKPSFEPIIVARKPLAKPTLTENVLAYGTGALNIDATRVGSTERDSSGKALGRFSPNVVMSHLDGCEQVGVINDEFVRNTTEEWSGFGQKERPAYKTEKMSLSTDVFRCMDGCQVQEVYRATATKADTGVTSKFFPAFRYQKKAAKKEKPMVDGESHVSVKPLELMRWMVKLVTPVGGTVLDPFVGSGTTVEAARIEGFSSIGIESHEPYLSHIEVRIKRSS